MCIEHTWTFFLNDFSNKDFDKIYSKKKNCLWNHTSLGQFGRDPHTSQSFDMEVDFIFDFFLWIFSAYFNCLDNRSSLTGISGNYGVILICVKWFNTQFCWIHTKVSESKNLLANRRFVFFDQKKKYTHTQQDTQHPINLDLKSNGIISKRIQLDDTSLNSKWCFFVVNRDFISLNFNFKLSA